MAILWTFCLAGVDAPLTSCDSVRPAPIWRRLCVARLRPARVRTWGPRMTPRTCRLDLLMWFVVGATSAVFADDKTTKSPSAANLAVAVRGSKITSAAARPTPSTNPGIPQSASKATPSFADRVQAVRRQQVQQQVQQAVADQQRPTAWALQNPSGPENRIPTAPGPTGPLAPNNYFGPEFRAWSNLSAPVSMTQLPFNQSAAPPVTESNVPLAPNTYYGPQFAEWNNLSTSTGVLNPLGGWNYR